MAESLLDELSRVDHDSRMRRMVELGPRAAADATLAAEIEGLAEHGVFGRYLRLQARGAARDSAAVASALADPSRTVRGLAVRLIPEICSDADVLLAPRGADRRTRLALLHGLRRRNRQPLVDAFLDELAERDGDQLVGLLPLGSAVAVERHFGAVEERCAAGDWLRFAATHAFFTANALLRRTAAITAPDAQLLAHANAALPNLADAVPDRAIALVGELLRQASPASIHIPRKLERRRPVELAEMFAAAPDRVNLALGAYAYRLPEPLLLALLNDQPRLLADLSRPRNFARLSPPTRAAVYARTARGWRSSEGVLSHDVVALLPAAERLAEGRRHLGLPVLSTRPEQRLLYAAFLPWPEARTLLLVWLGDPDADLRAAAWRALVFALRYQRSQANDLLALAHARRHEQDPVRGAMLSAIADLPPSTWRAEQLDALGEVIRDALDAADLSSSTSAAAERLVVRLAALQPLWAGSWLATLARERGRIASRLGDLLSDAEMRVIAPNLLPVLAAWATHEREAQLIAAAAAIGRRLPAFPELLDVLASTLRETVSAGAADGILRLFARYAPRRLPALLPTLIISDSTWARRPIISDWLHRRRQDLLTPYLGLSTHKGRFDTGRTRVVLPFINSFFRWLPVQQQTFALILEEVARDAEQPVPSLLNAIIKLVALPDNPPTLLIALARDERPAVQEAALRALGRLDAGQGLETLIAALGDDRARTAVYALRRALLTMPEQRALAVLRAAPRTRVTVAKEIVRLLGELKSDAAYTDLLALERTDIQRDVRVALLRALWDHLDRESTWPILEAAAASLDPAIARGLARIPTDGQNAETRRRLIRLFVLLLEHPEPRVRLEALGRFVAMPVHDEEQHLLRRLLALLDASASDERKAAADALFAITGAEDAALIGAAMTRLLPDRRALRSVTDQLQRAAVWSRDRFQVVTRTILAALAADPLTASLRAAIALTVLPLDEAIGYVTAMAAADELHPDAFGVAGQNLSQRLRFADTAEVQRVELALADSADSRLRRLALTALTQAAAAPSGWDDARLARLREFRADPSALVAAAAQFTLPAAELP